MKIDQKQIGIAVIALAVVVGVLVFLFNQSITATMNDTCSATMDSCPHRNNLPYQTYAGGLVVLSLIGLGVYSIWAGKQKEGISKTTKQAISNLPAEEKKIYSLLEENNGAMFQSEVVEKSQENKVKVSRILDKLEGRGLIQRRRQGMTNLVVLTK